MKSKPTVALICFGEINTPMERLKLKHDHAVETLKPLCGELIDAGIVIDDAGYQSGKAAAEKLQGRRFSALVVCVTGWIPTHAVIQAVDPFRHVPMLLWGMCGWKDGGRIITTADQAGTTALRPAFEEMGFTFKYVYSVMGRPEPVAALDAFLRAAHSAFCLRDARVGTMGYRDMLLYGTAFEPNSMRSKIGVEVETFEMLEMVQLIDTLDAAEVQKGIDFVRKNWVIEKPCADEIIERGVKYALAVGKKVAERGYEAVTLNDVDGMKKLLGFPPAMVFMLLDAFCGVQVLPENDVLGNVTQLMMKYITGQDVFYLEYYEFFEKSLLAGVPDFIPAVATDGEVHILPAAFGLLESSLLNVSRVKPGPLTGARLVFKKGKYCLHMYTGEGKAPPSWAEFGWDEPIPQLPSLEIFPDSCTVPEFAQKVCSQHVLISYGNHAEALCDLCAILGIEVIR